MLPTKRIEYIDAMRGFTMILVVYSHLAFFSFGDDAMGYNDIFMRFRMPVFFFISGWVFFKAQRIWDWTTVKQILKKKFMVQIIPFAVFFLLYMYVFDILSVDSLGNGKNGYWFTFSLFEYFVVYVLLVFLFQKNAMSDSGELKVLFFVIILSAASFYYSKYYGRYATELGALKGVLGLFSFTKFRYFIYFWFGTFVRKHFGRFVELTDNQYFMALVIVVFVSMIVSPAIYSVDYGVELVAYLLTALGGITLIFTFFRKHEVLFSKERALGNGLQFIGRRTLDIYLLHYFFLPYNLSGIGDILHIYSNKFINAIIMFALSLLLIVFCLFISEVLRLSPFLAHYLFGAKRIEVEMSEDSTRKMKKM